jgi:DNA adenine methylase
MMPATAARPSRSDRSKTDDETEVPGAHARSFLKWAGGKNQLLADFAHLYPPTEGLGAYHEPFLGSAAVFFHVKDRLAPRRAILSDGNVELINAFVAVRDQLDAVVAELKRHQARHCTEYFYEVRDQVPAELSGPAARAARFIYLNKTCFNGLYRVNSRGLFNVPIGSYVKPAILQVERLRRASAELAGVELEAGPFTAVLDRARAGDFVYFDPPYFPVSSTSYFTAYTEGEFGPQEQRLLAGVYRVLADRGCKVMLSNSDAPFVRELYQGFDMHQLRARRNINSNTDARGHVGELVILNYSVGRVPELPKPASRKRKTSSAKAGKVRKRGTVTSR